MYVIKVGGVCYSYAMAHVLPPIACTVQQAKTENVLCVSKLPVFVHICKSKFQLVMLYADDA